MPYLASLTLNPLFAQAGAATNSASWALVLFCVILGLLVAESGEAHERNQEAKRLIASRGSLLIDTSASFT